MLEALGGFLLLLWVARAAFALHLVRKTKFLNDVRCPDGFRYPKLSVIIPARDEASKIEAALRAKLATDYPDIEFIIIDDRSSDGTGTIIKKLAATDNRVRQLAVTELPPGWLGKVNALAAGTRITSGDWLLFSDADVHFSRDALKKAVFHAEHSGLDHLGVMPDIWTASPVVAMLLVPLQDAELRWATWDSRSAKPGKAVGVGAFNLVRRDAFEKTPGFEWLRLEVIDDMGLGLMMREYGFKGASICGRGCVGLVFLENFGEALRSCGKGILAGLEFNRAAFAAAGMLGVTFDIAPFVLAALGSKLAACACLVALAKSALLSRWARRPLWPVLFLPIAGIIALFMLLHAGFSAWRAGGISWRDTVYPIGELKAHKRFRLKNFY